MTLGDSYISGEAGRWLGNSAVPLGGRAGTDRAWRSAGLGSYDPALVYGDTAKGCDRSDVAPVVGNDVPVDAKINLACSGAQTVNVFRASEGGTGQNGEQPQADQLAAVAATHDVDTVVLSIGGNDLGFADIIPACVVAHATATRCEPGQQAAVDAAMPTALADVARAVDEVRAVLAAQGQPVGSYRLVLQSYPSPVPRGDDNRYAELAGGRLGIGGCPIGNSDSDWARDSLVPQISDNLAAVAAATGRRLPRPLRRFLRPRGVRAHGDAVDRHAHRRDGGVGAVPRHRRAGVHPGVVAPQRLRAARDGALLHAAGRGRGVGAVPQHPRPRTRRHVPGADRRAADGS